MPVTAGMQVECLALILLMQGWLAMRVKGAVRPPKTQPSLVRVLCLQPPVHAHLTA